MHGITRVPETGLRCRAMEPILDYLSRKLREATPRRWGAISDATGVKPHALRKLAYGDKPNPGLAIVQPLLTYFHEVDAGKRDLPPPAESAAEVAA